MSRSKYHSFISVLRLTQHKLSGSEITVIGVKYQNISLRRLRLIYYVGIREKYVEGASYSG